MRQHWGYLGSGFALAPFSSSNPFQLFTLCKIKLLFYSIMSILYRNFVLYSFNIVQHIYYD